MSDLNATPASAPHPGDLSTTRRRVLSIVATCSGAVAAGLIGVPCLRVLLSPLDHAGLAGRHRVVPVAALAESRPQAVTVSIERVAGYRKEVTQLLVWAYLEQGTPVVLDATCTHMGCNVAWSPAETLFVCPCHGGRYDTHGVVKSGPPPRSLRRLDARVEDGMVWIELGAPS